MNIARLLRHLFTPAWRVRQALGAADRAALAAAVAASERQHRGELRLVVEGPLSLAALLRGQTPRQRAGELFGALGVWDTAENSGVLLYVQHVDRRVEILADRGIAAKVPQAEWEALCRAMEAAFARDEYRAGLQAAIDGATRLLVAHFPAVAGDRNELPNEPLLL